VHRGGTSSHNIAVIKISSPMLDCCQSVFLSKFGRGKEARRFSLKGNGTRRGPARPKSLFVHTALMHSRTLVRPEEKRPAVIVLSINM